MSYIKLNSLEDGPYSSTYNNSDLVIPADDYDFDKSYLLLQCSMPATFTNAGEVNLPFLSSIRVVPANANTVGSLHSVSLIKNCSLSTDVAGRLEDMRRTNILRQNLKDITLSQAEKISQQNSTYSMIGNYRDEHNVLFRKVEKNGTLNSQLVQSPIRIPLEDLFGLGGRQDFRGSKLGNTRIHLELQPDVMQVQQLNDNPAIIEGIVVQPIAVNDTVIKCEYDQNLSCPFYNGLSIQVPIDGAAAGEEKIITGIAYNVADKTYDLTINSAMVGALAAAGAFSATAYLSKATGQSFVINKVEIVLKKYNNPLPAIPSLNYRTFTTEEVNGFGIGTYSKMFYLEPECVNLFILFPRTEENGILSIADPALTYRLRVDNVDLTNRDITVNTPLYHDRINMTFNNAGNDFKLKNLRMTNNPPFVGATVNKLMMICTPVPPTQKEKLLQVTITSKVAIPRMILFKQCLRSVNL